MRLRVNPIKCVAHGLCAELLPEAVRIDEWGYPLLDDGELDPALVEHAPARRGRMPNVGPVARIRTEVRRLRVRTGAALSAGATGAAALVLAACGASGAPRTTTIVVRRAPTTVASPTSSTAPKPAPKAAPPSYPQLLGGAIGSGPTDFVPAIRWRGETAAWIARSSSGFTLMSFNQKLLELRLHSGTVDAGTLGWRYGPSVGGTELGHLAAAFNGRDGLGSIVTYSDGSSDIASWHQEVTRAGQAGRLRPSEPDAADRPRQPRLVGRLRQLLGRDAGRRVRSPAGGRTARRACRASGRARRQSRMGRRLPVRTSRRQGTARARSGALKPARDPRRVPRSLESGLLHARGALSARPTAGGAAAATEGRVGTELRSRSSAGRSHGWWVARQAARGPRRGPAWRRPWAYTRPANRTSA